MAMKDCAHGRPQSLVSKGRDRACCDAVVEWDYSVAISDVADGFGERVAPVRRE
jgi:hypothetical protein